MLSQFYGNPSSGQLDKDNLHAALASVFHGGNAIRIGCHQSDSIHILDRRIGRHIQADAHIYALLLENWFEICIGECCRPVRWNSFEFETAEFKYTKPDRKKVFSGEVLQPLAGIAEGHCLARDGEFLFSLVW